MLLWFPESRYINAQNLFWISCNEYHTVIILFLENFMRITHRFLTQFVPDLFKLVCIENIFNFNDNQSNISSISHITSFFLVKIWMTLVRNDFKRGNTLPFFVSIFLQMEGTVQECYHFIIFRIQVLEEMRGSNDNPMSFTKLFVK